MPIPEEILDRIRDRTDIVELISRYVPLKKAGRNYKAPCPFHQEKTPSFVVNPDKRIYHCFGCGAGGNAFSFVMRYENMQFPEAVEMLAEKAGIELPRTAGRGKEENSLANKLYKVNELACRFFQENLASSHQASEYLGLRGIGAETIKKFRVGYAPDAWESLINFFRKKGAEPALLEKAGLAISNEKGGHYDRFRNRITFPIADLKDRILGFGARVMDSSLPKYINSPETAIYSKGRHLYGLNISRESIKKEAFALVVEGYLDFIIPYQADIKNIIATLGTALTVDQVKLIKRFANTVIIVYDPDEAGQAASLRGLDLFISEDVNVYIAELPAGYDPDGYIRKFGTEEFLKLSKSSRNIFEYKFDKLAGRFDVRTAHGKASIAGGMLPTIAKINNAVFKADLVRKLADRLGVDEDSIKQELKKVRTDYNYNAPRQAGGMPPARVCSESAEVIVLALLFSGADFIDKVKEVFSLDDFKNSSIRDAASAVFGFHKDNKEATPAGIMDHLGANSEASAVISEAVNLLDTIASREKALEDCVTRIKKNNLKDRLASLQGAIKMAHGRKDDDMVKELVREYNGLVRAAK